MTLSQSPNCWFTIPSTSSRQRSEAGSARLASGTATVSGDSSMHMPPRCPGPRCASPPRNSIPPNASVTATDPDRARPDQTISIPVNLRLEGAHPWDMKLELVPVPTSDSTGRSPSTPISSASPSTSTPTPRSGPRRPADPPGSAGSIVLSTGLDAISDLVPGTVKGLYLVVTTSPQPERSCLAGASPSATRPQWVAASPTPNQRPGRQHPCASTDGLANRRAPMG